MGIVADNSIYDPLSSALFTLCLLLNKSIYDVSHPYA